MLPEELEDWVCVEARMRVAARAVAEFVNLRSVIDDRGF